jgi:hypothetical protein
MKPFELNSNLHGNGFERVVIGGTILHLLFKPETVVGFIPKIKIISIVLRRIHSDHALLGERNIDIKRANSETNDECRPRNVGHGYLILLNAEIQIQ